ncbi:MAG: O-antigen ligase family protein [FCB group bacterium]|nr:O-antigen ligase family protein [FCB group bacterium]
MFKVRPIALFFLILIVILFERISIPKFPVSYFRLIAGAVMFIVLLKAAQTRKLLIHRKVVLFMIIVLVPAFLGLETRNLLVLLQYIFGFFISVTVYNLIPRTWTDREKSALVFVLAFIGTIGALTLITDYFGWTKFTLLFSKEIYNEAQSGRGAGILGGETNFTAARLSSLLPFALFLILKPNRLKYASLFGLPFVILIVVGIILTGSRMGYLALVQVFFLVMIYELGTSSWTRKLLTISALVMTIGIGGFALTFLKNQAQTMSRFESLESVSNLSSASYEDQEFDDSLLNRFILFWVGVDIIHQHPILGVGIGNAKYIPPKLFPFESNIKYLHNTFLEFGAENGLPALVAMAIFLVGLLKLLLRQSRTTGDPFLFYFFIGFYILLFNWIFLTDFTNKLFWSCFFPVSIALTQQAARD